MMNDKGIHTEIKDAAKTVALTEQKCAATTQRILEMVELEKTKKDWVTGIVHILIVTFFKLSIVYKNSHMHVVPFVTDCAIEI